MNNSIFGRLNSEGNVVVLHVEDGEVVTQIEEATNIYPVDSGFSCAYEHPEGIILTQEDAAKLGLEIE